MLAANLFCGPSNCVQCVENTDMTVKQLKIVENGRVQNAKNDQHYNMMDEMLLDSTDMEFQRAVFDTPKLQNTWNHPAARQRSFSAKDLRSLLKEQEKEATIGQEECRRGSERSPGAQFRNVMGPKPPSARAAYPKLLGSAGRDERNGEKRMYLDYMLAAGDVLAVADRRQITRIGGTGGMFGHVMVVTAVPRCIRKHNPEASDFVCIWPAGKVREIYQVPVIESTRANEGIHETDLLLYVDPKSGRIAILGEVDRKGAILSYDNPLGVPEEVELWQCPPDLRDPSCCDLKEAVIDEMKQNKASWSWGTAVRAFLMPAQVQGQYLTPETHSESGRQLLLKEVRECWKGAPICTSIPIIFWQRYLHKFSESGRAAEAPLDKMSAIDMIMMYMPLKADRTLPGELLKFLRISGWINIQVLPTRKGPQLNLAVPKGHSR
mmetsp:Transcript_159940/g.283387  ORF Transcript_159940/g.283387 Transcript_159940/m.283387 type:complete len:436 (-) Transcript_159940:11-1318(-)